MRKKKKRYAKKKKPNIAFKRDTPCRGILRLWVSSRVARCSGFRVGVPLNLTLGNLKRAVTFQCRGNMSHHAPSLFLTMECSQWESIVVADRLHSAP